MRISRRTTRIALGVLAVAAGSAGLWASTRTGMAIAPALTPGRIHDRPPVPVVFTSRSGTGSLAPASPEAEPYRDPVAVPWAEREGRLRLLDPAGRVFELTWDRALPDGSTLVDVMSPSVSLDGRRILFAGRRADGGRWRIFEVGVDGSGLRQLTGGPGDPGCVAVPPLRFRADGTRYADEERRARDFDDVDPADLGPSGFAFASSRLPDLGRDQSRRATQIWSWAPDASAPEPLTANRNNDRWPVLVAGNQVLFSLWTRTREAVTTDRAEVRPVAEGGDFATRPSDYWMAAIVSTNAAQFGYAIKGVEPVWRPRPLFNGRIAYMTSLSPDAPTRLIQAEWGHIRTAPSSQADGAELPDEGGARRTFGPDRDADGRSLVAACPSPAPDRSVLFAAAPVDRPSAFSLYSVADDWDGPRLPTPRLLFDDSDRVDAEPVAVYPRRFDPEPRRTAPPEALAYAPPDRLKPASGAAPAGPMGYLENIAIGSPIRNPIPWHDRSGGRRIDPRANPLVAPPPNIAAVAVYSAHRDRFDDPDRLRVPGAWAQPVVVPVLDGNDLRAWIASDPLSPAVIVGLDAESKVARWTSPASGNRPSRTYFAQAGDHYSGIRPNGYHYCNGCHTGHTFNVVDPTERTGR